MSLLVRLVFACLLYVGIGFGSVSAQGRMADPSEIDLKGSVRSENISTSLGRIHIRWPRKVEVLFGRTPMRAVADSARTVARFLNTAGFDTKLRKLSADWEIVFLDQDNLEQQIPPYLVNNCHPGWMLPPAKIYIVAQRVVHGCGRPNGKPVRVADGDLTELLLHEMGHVVEFHLLDKRPNPIRQLAEGFASWFEHESADYSSLLKKGSVREQSFRLARVSISRYPNGAPFMGTAMDYARASLFFHAIVRRGSVRHLMDVYADYRKKGDFYGAVKKRMGWSKKRYGEEMVKVLK